MSPAMGIREPLAPRRLPRSALVYPFARAGRVARLLRAGGARAGHRRGVQRAAVARRLRGGAPRPAGALRRRRGRPATRAPHRRYALLALLRGPARVAGDNAHRRRLTRWVVLRRVFALGAALARRVAARRSDLASLAALLADESSRAVAGRFEWVDGTLSRAIARGGWVLLDNANLCNPTVLDRLNPLLEPGGAPNRRASRRLFESDLWLQGRVDRNVAAAESCSFAQARCSSPRPARWTASSA